ncbi:YihY/virulence factor BrkB family protein [Parasphingorhabdus pacifica]
MGSPIPNDHAKQGDSVPTSGETPARRGPLRLIGRTLSKAWWDNIFSESAAAAFWQTLSLPPLLLGLLGSLGFFDDWFGPVVVDAVHGKILAFANTIISEDVVDQIIGPTVVDILTESRTDIVSVGFLLSLWAGSSALASLVDSITLAHSQYTVRHSVWQRIFALLLYLVSLIVAVIGLPVVALGPELLPTLFPPPLQDEVAWLIRSFYYPATALGLVLALTTLYKVALPRKLPWHRCVPGALLAMVVFLCSSIGLRIYITGVTSTGYTYGALATPIAFLLFAFFLAFAIILGAHFNNALQEMWPAKMTRKERRRWRRLEMRRHAQRMRTEEGYRAWRDSRSTADAPAEQNGTVQEREETSRPAGPEAPAPRQDSHPEQRGG